MLLSALLAFGCQLTTPLLTSAADLASANVGSFSPSALVDLLNVFAALRFHPGVGLPSHGAQFMLQVRGGGFSREVGFSRA